MFSTWLEDGIVLFSSSEYYRHRGGNQSKGSRPETAFAILFTDVAWPVEFLPHICVLFKLVPSLAKT